MDGEGPYSVGSHEVVHVLCAPKSRVCIACVAWLTNRLGLVSTGTHHMLRWENAAQCCLGHIFEKGRVSLLRRLTLPSVGWRWEILSMALFLLNFRKRVLLPGAIACSPMFHRKPITLFVSCIKFFIPYARSTRYTKPFFAEVHFSGTPCHMLFSHRLVRHNSKQH